MSYQYPPPLPSSGPEMEVSHPGYAPDYGAPAPVPSLMDPGIQDRTLKERKESFSQASLKLKRSMSTPNVRPRQANASDPNQSGLPGDKKRNKLGYHRTSVACGHCRRRKIRCIASPAFGESRCINCIRLKKECSFFPVDQPPLPQTTDPRHRAPSRTPAGSKVTSASSSPAMVAGQSPDVAQRHHFHPDAGSPASGMAPPPVQLSAFENHGPEATMSSGVTTSASRVFGFSNQSVAWMSPESPTTPSFSPYTSQPPPLANWGNPDPNGPGDMGYSSFAPGSSMTYPRGTPLPPQNLMMTQQNRQLGRKSSAMSEDIYPTHIATQFPNMEPHNASLSAGAIPSSGYSSWVPPPFSYATPHEGYEGWTYEESEGH